MADLNALVESIKMRREQERRQAARNALADAMCGETFIADWYEKADRVLDRLAGDGWQLLRQADVPDPATCGAVLCPRCGEVIELDAELTGDVVADEQCILCHEADERAEERASEGDRP